MYCDGSSSSVFLVINSLNLLYTTFIGFFKIERLSIKVSTAVH